MDETRLDAMKKIIRKGTNIAPGIKRPEINVRQAIINGTSQLVVNTGKYEGHLQVSLVDAQGNVALEKQSDITPRQNLNMKLPPIRGLYFVIIESKMGEFVKRVFINDSFNNTSV